ncbi:hypothetical protein NIES4072_13250 [Nostoc commune NIES-4072]|uniref:Uncharacterized protein n=1 Tax=Nostoc commune NIES-4072 TaxID=2005467 RepID=A0A2R5FPV3_NOSCO|nr:hypothetical protein NIES4070_13570 [Nostoc commune HK-02]GBG17664.1 hypothetical protein NIES4072_13250 [Nostoc commune NIES-4072]
MTRLSAETVTIAAADYIDCLLKLNLFFYLHKSQSEEKYTIFKSVS